MLTISCIRNMKQFTYSAPCKQAWVICVLIYKASTYSWENLNLKVEAKVGTNGVLRAIFVA